MAIEVSHRLIRRGIPNGSEFIGNMTADRRIFFAISDSAEIEQYRHAPRSCSAPDDGVTLPESPVFPRSHASPLGYSIRLNPLPTEKSALLQQMN
jgi:hypothetical protein